MQAILNGEVSKKIIHIFLPLPFMQGGTPLHYYVWADNLGKEKTDCLVSLLTAGEVEVDSRTEEGNTPLHLAVKVIYMLVLLKVVLFMFGPVAVYTF